MRTTRTGKLHAYDVRLERNRGRQTIQVAALTNDEAQRIAAHHYPGWEILHATRSKYAIGIAARRRRREALAA